MKILNRFTFRTGFAIVVLILVVWLLTFPRPWAEELARSTVTSCYSACVVGDDTGCGGSFYMAREANEAYGTLQSFRILSTSRGLSNEYYTVRVEATRTNGPTREEIRVHAFEGREGVRHGRIDSINVEPR